MLKVRVIPATYINNIIVPLTECQLHVDGYSYNGNIIAEEHFVLMPVNLNSKADIILPPVFYKESVKFKKDDKVYTQDPIKFYTVICVLSTPKISDSNFVANHVRVSQADEFPLKKNEVYMTFDEPYYILQGLDGDYKIMEQSKLFKAQ
jgi:hypothetical protein